jgi:protein ImuB
MTIVCADSPEFLYALAAQRRDDWRDLPVLLLGPDTRVWAASPVAQASGVTPGLALRLARARCPDAHLAELDLQAAEAAQNAFLGVLTETGMPVEAQDYGVAYCNLASVAHSPSDARQICATLGAQIRRELGDALTPALGVDHSKFTARTAARIAKPGSMRLVNREDEARFLMPQPVSLLPLPPDHVRQLGWLGLRTLGEFARLPVASVAARFGKAGVLAQRWARGHDERPVRALSQPAPDPVSVDFESPCGALDRAVADAGRALIAPLRALSDALEGCRRVQLSARFIDGETRLLTHTLASPTCQLDDVRIALTHALRQHAWPSELVSLSVRLLDIAELTPQVLTLFGDTLDPAHSESAPFAKLSAKLGAKHPGAFFRATITDAAHPLAERRVTWEGI